MSKPIFREPSFSERFDAWLESDLNLIICGVCIFAAFWIGLEVIWRLIALYA